ncbi:MAG: hypothetical protein JXA82_04320, partial [Sedimentisphaerales bacterium]|nr:hypothetical protein [Sedimentisphaerales bacterium]
SLPVTVMVNVAIQLARRGQRIGLIDLDTERKAVAEVFDVSGKGKQAGLVSSCIENIAVWMGDANSVQQAVTETQKACGHVLIYAPQSTAWAQPALQDCGRVVAFGHGVEDMEEIQGLCRDLDEGVLAMFPSPSEAVE